uniref:Leucine rich immune protein (Coil-less) n=1 Tax=Anopheles albimanus TaxID=7167 RepID=A0A8W7K7C0_ANOAL
MLYPDGEIAQMLSGIASGATYHVFYGNTLRIPANCNLKVIILKFAPQLQTIKVSGTNNVLHALHVHESAMRRIPTSLRHLQGLQTLLLKKGVLRTFSLENLEGIRNLTTVGLRFNMLRRLEPSKDSQLIMPIEDLDLSYNQLEFVDMEFFIPFKRLQRLQLNYNQIKQIIATNSFVLPLLHYMDLDNNELKQLNVSKWNVLKLDVLMLDNNNLSQLPIGIDRFTSLLSLYLSHNQLTTLDLRELEPLQKLRRLQVFNNQLHTVQPNCQALQNNICQRVSLPTLNHLDLHDNKLTSIDFNSWDLPELRMLDLSTNQLKRVLNLNKKFLKLKELLMHHNDIYCLVRNGTKKDYNMVFDVQAATDNTTCLSNSSFPHPYEQGVTCCND